MPPEIPDVKLYLLSAGVFAAFFLVTVLSIFRPPPEDNGDNGKPKNTP